MEFLDKIRKKRNGRVNSEDILLREKPDRRLLSYVPDKTEERMPTDRRGSTVGEGGDTYEDVLQFKKSGIRFMVDFEVVLTAGLVNKISCKGTAVDVSNTGMLIRFTKDNGEVVKKADTLMARFTVVPGSMPEGYEMNVKQQVKVARIIENKDDDDMLCAVNFSKPLSDYAAVNKDRYMLTVSAAS